jgi:hypothetical protein
MAGESGGGDIKCFMIVRRVKGRAEEGEKSDA